MTPPRIQRARQILPRRAWVVIALFMGIAAAPSLFIPSTGYFVFDSEPAFYIALGTLAPVLFIIIARLAGFVLKRPAGYWALRRDTTEQGEDGA